MGKLWPLFLSLALACAVLNPYVGLFSLFFLIEFLVFFSMAVNIKSRVSLHSFSRSENEEAGRLARQKRSASALINTLRVLAVVFFIICTVVSCGVWMLSSGRASAMIAAKDMAPFSLFSPENKAVASIVLLLGSTGFHLLAAVSIWMQCKQFSAQLNGEAAQDNIVSASQSGELSFKVNIPVTAAAWFAAMVFGLLNTRFGWLSIILHLFYLLFVGILKLTVQVYVNVAKQQSVIGTNARYMLSNMVRGKPLNRLFQAILWMIAGLIVLVQIICSFAVSRGVFLVMNTGLDMLMLFLSCGFNIVVVLVLCASIRRMQ